MQEQKIKVNRLCPDKSNHSHRCFLVLNNYTMTEDIYLHKNDCNEDNVERVLLHEFIHTILYHFLDEENFQSLLPKLINNNDLDDYMKKELISSKYDNPTNLIAPLSKNWFSTLFEDWNSPDWIYTVNPLMESRWKK
jgi:hypothetical protein